MKQRCAHHKPITDYAKFQTKGHKGHEQRQCPTCLRWYFLGEFGRGWAKGLKVGNNIDNIFKTS